MNKLLALSLTATAVLFVPQKVLAHCPLCTAGAGAIAVIAAALGVKIEVVGLFIGAFAAALGLYVASRISRRFVKGQKWIVATVIFVLTTAPLLPLMSAEPYPLVVYWLGEMGSLFNRVYLIDRFIVGSLLGAGLMIISPKVSLGVAVLRNGKRSPYQGIVATLSLLVIFSLLIQFAI